MMSAGKLGKSNVHPRVLKPLNVFAARPDRDIIVGDPVE
jgi:hypothetical protein